MFPRSEVGTIGRQVMLSPFHSMRECGVVADVQFHPFLIFALDGDELLISVEDIPLCCKIDRQNNYIIM